MPDMSVIYFSEEQAATHPHLRELVAIKSKAVSDYKAAFATLLGSSFLTDVVTEVLQDPEAHRARIESSGEDQDWRLLRTEEFTLGVRKLPALAFGEAAPTPSVAANIPAGLEKGVRRIIAALPNDALIGVVGNGNLTADLYRSATDRDHDVFDRKHRIELFERKQLKSGDQLLMRAGNDLMNFVEVKGEVATLELAIRDADRIVWNYDLDTLEAVYASSASIEATRMEFAIELFRVFNERKALPSLLRIAKEHTHHWVRWKAVKTMLHIDRQAGIEALYATLEDKHEHVRRATQKTLDNFRTANILV
jgi:hypothetical protein